MYFGVEMDVKQNVNLPASDILLRKLVSNKIEDNFDPFSNWTNRYRILPVTYFQFANETIGYLVIKKRIKNDKSFELQIMQRLRVKEESHFFSAHILKATILCRNDAFATPEQWEWTSSYKHQNSNTEILRLQETATYTDGRLERETRNGVFHAAIQGYFSLEWCLLDAIQRFHHVLMSPFTMLDKFSQLKPNQHIIPNNDNNKSQFNKEGLHLTRYIQSNKDISNHEYWLDMNNRLIWFSDGMRMFLLKP